MAASIMLYFYKRDFAVQKAERWFKERGVTLQLVDMSRKGPGLKELKLFAERVGLPALIDRTQKAYLEHPVRFMAGEGPILEALMSAPKLLSAPIVRCGQRVTVGMRPEVWATWLEN